MELIDQILSPAELTDVRTRLASSAWGWGYISNDPQKPIWNLDKKISADIANILINKLTGYALVDYHVNGQTLGQQAAVHRDSDYGKSTHALVYFPNPWQYEWGGRLHIFDTEPRVITPKENFGVLFDAELLHYAEAPTENVLRVSVGLKLRKIDG